MQTRKSVICPKGRRYQWVVVNTKKLSLSTQKYYIPISKKKKELKGHLGEYLIKLHEQLIYKAVT